MSIVLKMANKIQNKLIIATNDFLNCILQHYRQISYVKINKLGSLSSLFVRFLTRKSFGDVKILPLDISKKERLLLIV